MLLRRIVQSNAYYFSTLTLPEADSRAKLILKNSVTYHSHIALHKGSTYNGFTNIHFQTTDNFSQDTESLRIDFQGKKLTGLMVNEKILDEP